MAETIEGEDARGTLAVLCRVSDRREEGIATFAPGHWQTERHRSQDIVVSARGWLVVNPLGVTTPTVGWKRAPLSAVASIAEVISDKCFAYIALKFICCHICSWTCGIVNVSCEGIVCTTIVNME
jgi:hypothetical protein